MFRRDRSRAHAAPTARARRIRAAAERDADLRAKGIDPADERGAASPWGPPAAARASDGRQTGPSAHRTSTEPVAATAAQPTRRVPFKRVLITALVLVLGIVLVGSFLLYQRVDAFNNEVSTAPTLSTSLFGPLGGKERVNVLMVGYAGEAGHGGTYLADSLNILSVDPVANATTLIPVPRDLWIAGVKEMPGGGKVNLAFALGWKAGGWQEAGRAQAAVLSAVTGLRIDHWISIDFSGLSRLVESVGGVDVVNPRAFQFTWSEYNFEHKKWTGGGFKRGPIHLDGTQALWYSRARYTSVTAESSDFARSVRQQRVISALRDKTGSGGFGSLGPGLAMMDALKGHLRTDLSALDLFLLSSHLHADRRLELKEGVILQAGRNDEGSYILFPIGAKSLGDYAPLERYIATNLAKPIPSPTAHPTATPAA